MQPIRTSKDAFEKIALTVTLMNFAYFLVECIVAQRIGSVSLYAGSIAYFEYASVTLVGFFAQQWPQRLRATTSLILAMLIFIPVALFVWQAWQKVQLQIPPSAQLLTVTGLGGLMVNLNSLYMMGRIRQQADRSDRTVDLGISKQVISSLAIVLAGLTGLVWSTAWPDLIVGGAIAALNVAAANRILTAMRPKP